MVKVGWVVGLFLLGGCSAPQPGWATICAHAPYAHWAAIPAWMVKQLAVERINNGEHGWYPTAEWVNEQCQVLHPATRKPNRHSRW